MPLLLLQLLLFPFSATAAEDFAFPKLMDVLCDLLQAEDIPAAMGQYGPVTPGKFVETVFHHKTWTVDCGDFTLEYDISQELEEDGSVSWEDYLIEATIKKPGAALFFNDMRQVHGWIRELGKVTLDSGDQVEATARPFPGEEKMAPLGWRIRVFCDPKAPGSSPCHMIRFFWNKDTAAHNKAFCRP